MHLGRERARMGASVDRARPDGKRGVGLGRIFSAPENPKRRSLRGQASGPFPRLKGRGALRREQTSARAVERNAEPTPNSALRFCRTAIAARMSLALRLNPWALSRRRISAATLDLGDRLPECGASALGRHARRPLAVCAPSPSVCALQPYWATANEVSCMRISSSRRKLIPRDPRRTSAFKDSTRALAISLSVRGSPFDCASMIARMICILGEAQK